MPRIKPTSSIDVIGYLDIRPENAVPQYTQSKKHEKFFIKAPKWDSPGDTVDLLCIRNHREYEKMLDLQKKILEDAKKQSRINKSRIDQLYKRQEELRKRIIDVNSFIQDCERKRHLTLEKIAEEEKTQEHFRTKIAEGKAKVEQMKRFREQLQTTVAEYEPYETIIKEVVEKSDIFVSVKDCLDRCDSLMMAQKHIAELEQSKIQEIERMRKRMADITNESFLYVLGVRNELSLLESAYHQAQIQMHHWEKVLENAKMITQENEMNKDRMLEAIHQIYRMLCTRRKIQTTIKKEDVEHQLDFIKNETLILDAVVKECNRVMALSPSAT